LSQKIEANDPEKMPLTAVKATRCSAKIEFLSVIQCIAQSALHLVSTVLKRYCINEEGVSFREWMFYIIILNPYKH